MIKWLTPLFLTGLLVWFGWTEAIPVILMEGVPEEQVATRWLARLFMVAIFAVTIAAIYIAWKGKPERAEVRAAKRLSGPGHRLAG